MTDSTLFALVCIALSAPLSLVIYLAARDRIAACQLHRTLDQVLANTRGLETMLEHQRRVLHDAHKQISGVTKALRKTTL